MDVYLATLIYCLQEDRILLMHRNKEPNLGLWTGLGGKLVLGEAPYTCANRELYEESGFQAGQMIDRGVVNIVSKLGGYQWLLFVFVATDIQGNLQVDKREGDITWCQLSTAHKLPMPQADQLFFPHVTDLDSPRYSASFVFDGQGTLIKTEEYTNSHSSPSAKRVQTGYA
ncbi:MAG: 8-oxo-dGTP diphosphatase [Chloroflexota bacterium]